MDVVSTTAVTLAVLAMASRVYSLLVHASAVTGKGDGGHFGQWLWLRVAVALVVNLLLVTVVCAPTLALLDLGTSGGIVFVLSGLIITMVIMFEDYQEMARQIRSELEARALDEIERDLSDGEDLEKADRPQGDSDGDDEADEVDEDEDDDHPKSPAWPGNLSDDEERGSPTLTEKGEQMLFTPEILPELQLSRQFPPPSRELRPPRGPRTR